jgi:acyl carrier protein
MAFVIKKVVTLQPQIFKCKLMNIEEKVIAIVADKLGRDVTEVTPEKSFVNDLGADSLDTVELLMVFENEFKVKIPEDIQEKIATVGDAVKYITEVTK